MSITVTCFILHYNISRNKLIFYSYLKIIAEVRTYSANYKIAFTELLYILSVMFQHCINSTMNYTVPFPTKSEYVSYHLLSSHDSATFPPNPK